MRMRSAPSSAPVDVRLGDSRKEVSGQSVEGGRSKWLRRKREEVTIKKRWMCQVEVECVG